MTQNLFWIDDVRNPDNKPWQDWLRLEANIDIDQYDIIWVKTFSAFKEYINAFGLPDIVCFDHDLGPDEPSGYDFAKYIVDYCLDRAIDIPEYYIQSSNPVGKENIKSLMDNYHKFYLKNK